MYVHILWANLLISSTCENANACLSRSIHTSTETGVESNNESPRNPEGYYSEVDLVGSETGKIVTADFKKKKNID